MPAEHVVISEHAQPIGAYLNPVGAVRGLWRCRELIWQLARREVAGRYRESWLGVLWSVLTPLCLLAIYTFVFAVVFRARWGDEPGETTGQFALTMFCGMLVFTIFSELVQRSPGLIANNANFVKKVVFPLEALAPAGLLTALFNFAIGVVVWIVGWLAITWTWPAATIVYLPLAIVPVCLLTLGLSWLLASLGVFLRDVGHVVTLGVQVLFFATPIFYSLARVPQPYRTLLEANPLTHAVEAARAVMIYGRPPEWGGWAASLAASAAVALLGYAFFMKSKRAFADVI